LEFLAGALKRKAESEREAGVLLFADRSLPYQRLFKVLDQIRVAGLNRISLQAEVE
jgi:biopolymer transport protein ExbD